MRIMLNKYFILIGLLLIMTCTAFAEQRGVFLQFHRKVNVGKNMKVHRAPLYLPIDVVYDSDVHNIKVVGDKSIEAEVFLYNASGILVCYSSTLDTDIDILLSGTYTIVIQGEGWYAEGEIEM